ncbi:C4-dicarboxylate transporter DcuC [Serratia fonticola]|uniref:Cryptic C4-dicarboxylate transporter DcuD n=1 Tax=Serratia fonticola TaxID=47917 RepID=A0A448SEV4_SERFO|nr:C4-dicarboxylate transporter DcuC [Serratia fonticola]NTY86155.1 transporter [Serratia fonticola]NTZ12153.1 transporter [Serratia fonticola]CAI1089410.1 Putative cryptic C4-dicarboxylate transporter DcuD [Serratia fonticola]CAI2439820.1 Putative cryptic C4-dicarboxylate transporter DcuD [Serratia fonticola]VEI66227.1 Putative cryptic C4-dicarboxylate transporter DcuD [Serratia fonticola]
MTGFIIGMIVTVLAAWFIIKNYQPQTVLLLAGLSLLLITAVFFPEQSILYGKAKSIGWVGGDIFAFVKESLTTQVAGIGLIIMAAGGFADYMDHIKASNSMVNLCIKPLQMIKAPYLILAIGYILSQLLHVAISSAAGLAMLLLVTFFPVLVRLGVSKAAAASMIGMSAFMDLGPAVGTANLAAKHAGMETAVYFAHYQLPVATGVMLAVAVLIFFTARYFDAKDGHIVTQLQVEQPTSEDTAKVPAFYAFLPVFPVILVIVFSPLVISSIKVDVVTAMIIGTLLAFFCELLVRRDFKTACKGIQVFFKGMGTMFTSIVSLLVCADVFAQGLQIIGAVDFIIHTVQAAGFGFGNMTIVMALLVCVTAALTGSGVAAFFSFSGLAPGIAAKFGESAVSMILPMQLMAGMGRSISPVAGVIIAVSKAGECSPFMIVRRTLIPAVGGMITMLVLNGILN